MDKTDAETGHKKYVVTRARNPTDEELDECLSQQEGVYTEPGTEDDDEAIERAAEYQARKLWQALDGPKRSVRRLLIACFLCNVWDMKALLDSGLADCKQSQLYNERKAVFDLLGALDWGPDCLGPGQRAYMTRRLLPPFKLAEVSDTRKRFLLRWCLERKLDLELREAQAVQEPLKVADKGMTLYGADCKPFDRAVCEGDIRLLRRSDTPDPSRFP